MIKDTELFRDSDVSEIIEVESAIRTESNFEGKESIGVFAKEKQGQDQRSNLGT